MAITNLRVRVLSAVRDQTDVFDKLIHVKRMDTGEEGTLLCSHCCKWPKAALAQATWLEGCYTPDTYKDDTRLLMGYHPSSLTSWEVRKESNGVYLDLTVNFVEGGRDYDMGDWEQIELEGTVPYNFLMPPNPQAIARSGYMERLWQRSQEGRELSAALQSFYRTLQALVDSGHISLWASRCAWRLLNFDRLADDQLAFDYNFRDAAPRVPYCEVYADALMVVNDKPSEGYLKAIALMGPIPSRQLAEDNGFVSTPLRVSREAKLHGADQYGWCPSVNIGPILDSKSSSIKDIIYTRSDSLPQTHVQRDDATKGFWKAVDIQCYSMQRVNGEYYHEVFEEDLDAGFAVAMPIN